MAKRNIETEEIITSDIEQETSATSVLDELVYEQGLAPLASDASIENKSDDEQSATLKSISDNSSDDSEKQSKDSKIEKNKQSENNESSKTHIALVKGSTYMFKGKVFKKGETISVEQNIAERLIKSGYFERR